LDIASNPSGAAVKITEADRRRYARLPKLIRVRFHFEGEDALAVSSDVSQGGAFLRASLVPPTGTEMKLFVSLDEEAGGPFVAIVRVVRTVHWPTAVMPETGFGVQWLRAECQGDPKPLKAFLAGVLGVTKGLLRVANPGSAAGPKVFEFVFAQEPQAPPPVQSERPTIQNLQIPPIVAPQAPQPQPAPARPEEKRQEPASQRVAAAPVEERKESLTQRIASKPPEAEAVFPTENTTNPEITAPGEGQTARRVRVSIPVTIALVPKGALRGTALKLSHSGMAIELDPPLPEIATRMTVRFEVKSGKKTLVVALPGTVSRRRQPEAEGQPGQIEFRVTSMAAEAGTLRLYRDYVEYLREREGSASA
jgi:hypothetical protein